jgi:hypothetical protein
MRNKLHEINKEVDTIQYKMDNSNFNQNKGAFTARKGPRKKQSTSKPI